MLFTMSYKSVLSFICVLFINFSSGYRILGIFPHEGKSHHNMFDPILIELAKRGHEITVITHFPLNNPPENYTEINMQSGDPLWSTILTFDDINHNTFMGADRIIRPVFTISMLYDISGLSCEALVKNKQVKALKPGQFDLAIVEQFNSDCALGIVNKLKVPFVGFASHVLTPWTYDRLGLVSNPAFIPNHFLPNGRTPGFFETLESFILTNYAKYMYRSFQTRDRDILIKEYDPDCPDLEDLAKKMSLILTNTYFPLNGAFPVSPNLIEVGGLHLQKPKPISKDIKSFLDNSSAGVIVFSLGSMLSMSSMDSDKLDAFKEVFSILPQNILWKWENETMYGKPKNAKIVTWLPQADVLRHKNVKAFITHGGMFGMTEALSSGVPVVVLPMFGDQFVNAAAARDSGCGEILVYKDLTKQTIFNALKKVLSPEMQESAKAMGKIWNDRPTKPLDTAVFWIEHVAKHGGDHLRPNMTNLPLYRYLLLDIIGFLILVTLGTLGILYFIITRLTYTIRAVLKLNKAKSD